MGMKPETKFSQRVAKKLKLLAPEVWYTKVQQQTISGDPDYIICCLGNFVAWELKVPPNKVKPGSLQEYTLNAIVKAEGRAIEVTPLNFEQHYGELECLVLKRRETKQTSLNTKARS